MMAEAGRLVGCSRVRAICVGAGREQGEYVRGAELRHAGRWLKLEDGAGRGLRPAYSQVRRLRCPQRCPPEGPVGARTRAIGG